MELKKVGNRKRTKGRNVYYQLIKCDEKQPNKNGVYPIGIMRRVKKIKHIQESENKTKGASLMAEFYQLRNRYTKPSERTLQRKNERNRGRVVWNNGTYVRKLHGELK